MKDNRKITTSEKKLFVFSGLVVISIIACGAWRQYVNEIPDVKIPTPKMPSPNAYDFYVKAGAAIVKANPAVDPVHDTNIIPKDQWKTHYPTAAKEAWLKRNSTTLNLLRQGFKYPCHAPPRLSTISTSGFASYSRLREIARMLTVESNAHSERGNWNAALQSSLDTLKLGHDISKGGVLIDYLVGSAINAIGRRDLWGILPHLNARETKFAAKRLEKILENRALYAEILREEKYYGQADLLKMMRAKEWRTMDLNEATGLQRLNERWQMFKTPNRLVFTIARNEQDATFLAGLAPSSNRCASIARLEEGASPAHMKLEVCSISFVKCYNYTRYMDSLISNAQKPYNAKAPEPAIPDDIYNRTTAPAFSSARLNNLRDEAGNSLFLVSLALRAYRLENDRYPQTLNELVPNYLKKIPADAYGVGEPLHYKLKGAEYSLYSVGPDGIDNGGRAVEDKSKTGKGRFLVWDGKGDYVAGINY